MMSWSRHGRQPPAPGISPGDAVAVSQQAECWWLVTQPALDGYKKGCASPGWQTGSWVSEGREAEAAHSDGRWLLLLSSFSCVLQLDGQTGTLPDNGKLLCSTSSATQPENCQCSTGQIR